MNTHIDLDGPDAEHGRYKLPALLTADRAHLRLAGALGLPAEVLERERVPSAHQAVSFPIGLTAIRNPVAANTAFRLRSSGFPDFERIL